MKSRNNRCMSFAILGSLFALSCTYSGKVQARIEKRKPSDAPVALARTGQNKPIELKAVSELDEHLKSGKPVVLMIHASWCGACKVSMDTYADAAEDNTKITFLKAEGSKEVPGIDKRFDIKGYPTFVLFDKDGKNVHQFAGGGWPKSVLNQKIKEFIK